MAVIATAAIMTFFVARTFGSELTIFVDREARHRTELLSPLLARYYGITSNWSEIDTIFQDPIWLVSNDKRSKIPYPAQPFWLEDRRLIVADSASTIVFDSQGELEGSLMTESVRSKAVPIRQTASEEPAGYALIGSTQESFLTDKFQTDFRQGVVLVALMASGLAILIGFLLSRQLTAPIRRLTRATVHASDRDWQYTPTSSPGKDEVGQLEQAFSEMTERLHQVQEQRRQLLADVAHELRTPLTVISTNLEGMIDNVIPADQHNIASTLDQTQSLNRLIDDLRLISLTDANELQLDLELCSINDLATTVIQDFQPVAEEANIVLSLSPSEKIVHCTVDPLRFRQVLANLISNAIRYLDAGQNITVSITSTETTVAISITDSGPGISAEDRERIFERFYRTDKSRSRSTGGTGLGLAIARGLTEAQGGHLTLAPTESTGTTFVISLPIQ